MSRFSALGSIVVRDPLDQWRVFGPDVLGRRTVQTVRGDVGRVRSDDRARRIEVQDGAPGPDALIALGFEVPNDDDLNALVLELAGRMTSFYVTTLSGLATEDGSNGRFVDDTTWQVGDYNSPSVWGQHFAVPPAIDTDATTERVLS